MVTQLIWPKNRKQNKAFVEYSIVTKPKYLYENLRGVLNLWKLFFADKKKQNRNTIWNWTTNLAP